MVVGAKAGDCRGERGAARVADGDARKYGLNTGQLYTWRRQMLRRVRPSRRRLRPC